MTPIVAPVRGFRHLHGAVATVLCAALVACGAAGEAPNEAAGMGAGASVDRDLDDLMPSVVAESSLAEGRLRVASGAPQVIYSNYSDGTTILSAGDDDAPNNTSSICKTTDAGFPVWKGTDAVARQMQNSLMAKLRDFNVVLTAKRPVSGPYTMIMIGPWGNGCDLHQGGIAPLDCENSNPNDICFAFDGTPETMAQELGHTFGLGHVDVACDVMGSGYTNLGCPARHEWTYQDEAGPILGIYNCTGAATQNSYQEMKRVLGAWPGGPRPDPWTGTCIDAARPTLDVVSPPNGSRVGHDFQVVAKATDDCGLKEVWMLIPDVGGPSAEFSPPFAWGVGDVPSGAHDVILTAIDGADNATTVTTRIYVGDAPAPGGCGCASSRRTGASGLSSLPVALALLVVRGRRVRSVGQTRRPRGPHT